MGRIPASEFFAGVRLERPMDGGTLYACRDCHLRYRWPRLSKAEMDRLYRLGDPEAWAGSSQRRHDWQAAREIVLAARRQGAALDVGCADGHFLGTLPAEFEKFGIEINRGAAAAAERSGVVVIGDDFDAATAGPRRYDVITAFDVIEHAYDPRAFLARLGEALAPGGTLIVGTGNADAPSWRRQGARYWYCVFPEHVSFISPAWCRHVAPGLGLVVEDVRLFAHDSRSGLTRVKQAAANWAYHLFPGTVRRVRMAGVGGKSARQFPELADHPPAWSTAADHFIAAFSRVRS